MIDKDDHEALMAAVARYNAATRMAEEMGRELQRKRDDCVRALDELRVTFGDDWLGLPGRVFEVAGPLPQTYRVSKQTVPPFRPDAELLDAACTDSVSASMLLQRISAQLIVSEYGPRPTASLRLTLANRHTRAIYVDPSTFDRSRPGLALESAIKELLLYTVKNWERTSHEEALER